MTNYRIQLRYASPTRRWHWRIRTADLDVHSGQHHTRDGAIAEAEHELVQLTAQDVDVTEWHDYEPPKLHEFNIPKIAAEYRHDHRSRPDWQLDNRLTAEEISRAMGYYDRGGHDR